MSGVNLVGASPAATRLAKSNWFRAARCTAAGVGAAAAIASSAAIALAEPSEITLELNKLEANDKGCLASLVVNNPGETAFESLKLDIVVFQPDGVVGRWIRLNLAPLLAHKRSVKTFAIEGTACDKIGSLLINDVVECKAETGPLDDCVKRLKVSSLTPVQLMK